MPRPYRSRSAEFDRASCPTSASARQMPNGVTSPPGVLDIVQHELDELSRAASLLGDGQPESVARLRHQAAILTVVLAKAGH